MKLGLSLSRWSIVAMVLALSCLGLSSHTFLEFSKSHGRQFSSRAELVLRRDIFLANLASLEAHNARYEAGEETWKRRVTPYYDWTHEELSAAFTSGLPDYGGMRMTDTLDQSYLERLNQVRAEGAPESWDWVPKGAVSSVKAQEQCGSCAAFAAVAVIESCFWQQRNQTMFDDMSEQHVLDCAYNYYFYDDEGTWGCFGCDGGWTPAYMDWIVTEGKGKMQTEASYPYRHNGATDYCRPQEEGYFTGARVTGQYNKWNTDEAEMKEMVYISPVTTSIQATWLHDYEKGIYNDDRCCEQATDPMCRQKMNHEVTIVGYGSKDGMDYWIAKNSWGAEFGEGGFFRIKRGTGHCGVGSLHFTAALCTAE